MNYTSSLTLFQDSDPDCYVQKPIFPDVVVLMGLFIGTQISFLPQIIKIIIRKDIAGLSLHSFFFGTLSCSSVVMDGIITNWPRFLCCSLISSWKCVQSLLPFFQAFVNWFNYLIIFFLIALFVKNTTKEPKAKLKYRLTFTLYFIWFVLGGAIITIVMAPYGKQWIYVKVLAIFWTVISTSTIVIQWLPQIWTTWNYKTSGSLSLITLCINAPGSYLNFIFMIRGGQSPGTFLPYFFSGTQQLILIALLLVFMWKKRRARRKNMNIQAYTLGDDDDVSKLLLKNDSSGSSDSLDLVVNFIPDTDEGYEGH